MLPDRKLLRLHVNAGWDLHLSALSYGDTEMDPGDSPSWALYLGILSRGDVRIWRHDVLEAARASLIERALAALTQPASTATPHEITREVALRRMVAPARDVTQASQLARRMTEADATLLAAFYADDPTYLLAPERAPIFGVVEQGRLVSVAHSSRRTAEACELGLDTVPAARRRGYGLAVTVHWANAVTAEDKVPLYSALASNTASLALAHAAGYRPFARGVYISG